jgi:hypothetical protein
MLVMVAVVVPVSLLLLGPTVSNHPSNIIPALRGP